MDTQKNNYDIKVFKTSSDFLRNAEKTTQAWLDNSPICTKIVDYNLNLQYMSDSGIKGLGIPDISIYYGKPYPLKFYPQSFCSQMIKTIKTARDTRRVATQEAPVVSINGEEIWFHSTVMPFYDDAQQLEYYMIVSIDITERMFAEIKLHKMNMELESLVEDRTKELEKANAQLKINSETDFLTTLPNRRFYERRLGENIATAKRNNTYLSLIIIDIDNFKLYNDTYGHDFGDIILRKIANCIKISLQRSTDLVSRFGGEEFVVLLPDTNSKNAFVIAEKIRMNILGLDLAYNQSDTGNITVSIGIEALKDDKLNKVDLFKNSDIALYKAKSNGKNCSCIYNN